MIWLNKIGLLFAFTLLIPSCAGNHEKEIQESVNPEKIFLRFQQLKAEGASLGKQKKYGAAIEKWERAIKLNPGDAAIHSFLGEAYFRSNNPKKSLLYFNRANAIDPNVYEIQYALGFVYPSQGMFSEAEGAFKKALEIKPGDYPALLLMGEIGFDTNNFEMCQDYFQKYISLADAVDSSKMSEEEEKWYREAKSFLHACGERLKQ